MNLLILIWFGQTDDKGVRDGVAVYDATVAREQTRGRLLPILAHLAPELRPAIARLGRHVPCPVHGGRDGFRLFRDAPETDGGVCNSCGVFPNGFLLLMWLQGWRFPEALQAVAGVDGLPLVACTEPAAPRTPVASDDWRAERIRRVWAQSLPVDDSRAVPLRRYLARRGLDRSLLRNDALHFHPSLDYWAQGKRTAVYPALVAHVESADNQLVTLHRTYLTFNGEKAAVEAPRKLMAYPSDRTLKGCAIRLSAVAATLGVVEGIETALRFRPSVVDPAARSTVPRCLQFGSHRLASSE